MTRDSTTDDRRSLEGNASKIVRIWFVVGAERSIAVSVSQAKE
jgi:hypothetical protein